MADLSGLMRAAVAVEKGVVRCEEVEIPHPSAGEVLVRTRAASICGSDLHMVNTGWAMHAFPAMAGHPGHEAVGEVIKSLSGKFAVGDIVLTAPHIWNSRCFADYQVVDDAHVLKLASDVDIDTVTLAQQLGTVVYAAKRLPSSLEGQTCLVVGQGSAGLFWDFTLRNLGAEKIISIEPLAWRRELGLAYGVDETIDVTGDAAVEAVRDLTGGAGADLVIEAVGTTPTLSVDLSESCAGAFNHSPNESMDLSESLAGLQIQYSDKIAAHFLGLMYFASCGFGRKRSSQRSI